MGFHAGEQFYGKEKESSIMQSAFSWSRYATVDHRTTVSQANSGNTGIQASWEERIISASTECSKKKTIQNAASIVRLHYANPIPQTRVINIC